ncbi:MAG: hypothetical protein ABI822_03885, partial [Bryobacteraceae bacterium]
MTKPQPKGALERGVTSDLWRHTLSQIPSCFGRMVYLSSLRAPNTGRYEHHGLAMIFGSAQADKALRKTHTEAFNEWLNYSLEQQKADLDLYLSAQQADKREVVENWAALAPYRYFPPASAKDMERNLYLVDLEALLGMLKNDYGVSSP